MPDSKTNHARTVAHLTGTDPAEFRRRGAINMPLLRDQHVFIDPRLLERTTEPELAAAADKVYTHFAKVATSLAIEDIPQEIRAAIVAELKFPEPRQFALGLSKTSAPGHGIGAHIAQGMSEKIQVFAKHGLSHPILLGFMAITQDGVGGDLVSDAILNIANEEFVRYSDRIYRELGIAGEPHPEFPDCRLPRNPANGELIGLVPWGIVRGLQRDEINWRDFAGDNASLRKFLNERIRQVMTKQQTRPTKADIFRALVEARSKYADIEESYSKATVDSYDALEDPESEVLEDEVAFYVDHDAQITPPANETDFVYFVAQTCEVFRHFIEERNALYRREKGRVPEAEIQRIFDIVASLRCEQAGIDLAPETNAGPGPADFKFSLGGLKAVVELKNSDNPKVISGYEKQLPQYLSTEKTDHGFYLVVDQHEKESIRGKLQALHEAMVADNQGPDPIPVVWADANEKPSASKL